jgi:hypothetical protein
VINPYSISYVSALGLFALVLGIDVWTAKPLYNWDLLGYVGVAIAHTENNPDVIHRQTFSTVEAHVPRAKYLSLINANAYQISMAEHPEYFIQQLPFYSVKPLYPELMFLLNELGVNLVAASVLISKAAYLGIGVLLYLWILARFHVLMALVITSLIVSVPYVLTLARYSTPDALSTLVILAAFFCFAERQDIRTGLSLLVIAIGIRPDNILLLLITALYIAVFYRKRLLWAVGTSLVGVGLYAAEATYSGSYGWTTLFYHSFVQHLLTPSGFQSPLDLPSYLNIYLMHMDPKVQESSLLLFAMLGILAMAMYYRRLGIRSLWFHLLTVNSVFMVVHWLAFPGEQDRQFVASYLLILMALTNATNLVQEIAGSEEYDILSPSRNL